MSQTKKVNDTVLLDGILTNVVVFQGQAEFTHNVSLSISKGSHQLILQDVSALLLPESIRVTGKSEGAAAARINKTATRTRFEKQTFSPEIEKLKTKLKRLTITKEDLNAELTHMHSRLDNFNTLWARFTGSDSWPKRFGMGQISIKTLKEAEDFFQLNIQELQKESAKTTRKLEELKKDYQVTQKQFDHLTRGSTNIQHQDIIINVDVVTAGNFVFEIKYHVQNATWIPQYDIEVLEDKATLTSLAIIQNHTQIDWQNVQLTVSTASTQPAIAEEPNPYYLDIYTPMRLARKAPMQKRMKSAYLSN